MIHPSFAMALRIGLFALGATTLAGCSLSDLRVSDENRLNAATYGAEATGGFDPYNGAIHLARGRALLGKPGKDRNDLYFARAAFEHAALLHVDDPEPMYLVGYTNYRLGEFEAAYRAFAQAADLQGTADGWWLASLSALRAKHELLGQAFYDRGKQAPSGHVTALADYMRSLFEGPGRETVARNTGARQDPGFRCTDPEEPTEDGRDICSDNLVIELFVVERSSEAGSRVGQDLVSELSVGLNGTLLELTRATTQADGYEIRNGSTDTVYTRENTNERGRALTVDLAGVNYALSFAADADSVSYVSATPVINARIGEESKLFSGQSIQIIPANSDADALESETGMKVTLQVSEYTHESAALNAEIEFSTVSPPSFGTSFARIEQESTSIAASSRIGYNRALLLGSVELSQRKESTSGQKGLRKVPLFGGVLGQVATSVTRTEVAILATVRPPAALRYDQEALDLRAMRKYGVRSPREASRAAIIHKAPSLDSTLGELGVLKAGSGG